MLLGPFVILDAGVLGLPVSKGTTMRASVRKIPGIAIVTALVIAGGCVKDDIGDGGNPTGAGGAASFAGNSATVMVASYAQVGSDSIRIGVSSKSECDSNGLLQATDAVSQTAYYQINGNELKISLAVAPVLGQITQIPGFDPQMAGMLTTIGTLGATMPFYAVFERTDTGAGLEGAWSLIDLDLGFFGKLDSVAAIKNAALAAITTDNGDGLISLVLSGGTMTGNVERSFLSGAVASSIADSAVYSVSVDSLTDSSWAMVGGATGDSVVVAVDRSGNVLFSDSEGNDHTYYQAPESCPNELVDDWVTAFLEANRL